MLLDIDHFKKINDTFGHNKGDEILVEISEALLTNLRNDDLAIRYGGEEFLVVLPNISIENATQFCNRVQHSMRQISLPDGRAVTASFGISILTDELTVDQCVSKADEKLYQAKNSGRDCVVS